MQKLRAHKSADALGKYCLRMPFDSLEAAISGGKILNLTGKSLPVLAAGLHAEFLHAFAQLSPGLTQRVSFASDMIVNVRDYETRF